MRGHRLWGALIYLSVLGFAIAYAISQGPIWPVLVWGLGWPLAHTLCNMLLRRGA
jgi:hypothetical protein